MTAMKQLLIGLAGLCLLFQAASGELVPLDSFMDTIDVRVINIETVVTDRRGQRVHGLEAKDFRLLVDGREVPIDYFSEIREGKASEPEPGGSSPAVLPAADASTPNAISTRYLVFVDDVFPVGAHRNLVLQNLSRNLSILRPEDRMTIMAFNGRVLESLCDWTRSESQLRDALMRASKRRAGGPFRAQELRSFGVNEAASRRDGYADLLEMRIQAMVSAVTTSMRIAGRPEGRKVLLLLAGGWPYEIVSPGSPDLFNEAYRPRAAAGDPWNVDWDPHVRLAWARMDTLNDFSSYARGPALYQQISDTANRLGYTIYPVDVPGLGASGRSVEVASINLVAPTLMIGDPNESRKEASLLLLARETGGKAMLNGLRLKALRRTIEDTRSYYWLGFRNETKGNDLRHRVRVEVRHDGLRARSRRDYVDLSKQAEAAMATEAALLLGKSSGAGLRVVAGSPRKLPQRQIDLPLRLSIPVDQIAILPVEGGYLARLEISVQVMNKKRHPSDLQTIPVNLFSKSPPPAGSTTYYDLNVILRSQRHDLVVTLHDLSTGELLTTHTRVWP